MLDARRIASQGFGFALSPVAIAVQGFLGDAASPTPAQPLWSSSGAIGGGPDAKLSLSDYRRKFGHARAMPTIQARPARRHKKRQVMEEEILLLTTFDL